MSSFSLTLSDESIIEGKLYVQSEQPLKSLTGRRPLLVAVPGGTYTADFFDTDENHSLRTVCNALGVPVIALNRPGYGSTAAPVNVDKFKNSFIQQSGRWLHNRALPAIWDTYAEKLKISSLVLYGHSIGAGTCVVGAAEYEMNQPSYKISGLALGGLGCDPKREEFLDMFEAEHKAKVPTPLRKLQFPTHAQQIFMLGSIPEIFDPKVLDQFERLRNDIYMQELYDIEFLWPNYWKSYAELIKVPVLYNAGEADSLWRINRSTMREMEAAFSKSTWVSSVMSHNAPHAIEMSHQATGYYTRLLGFAIECASQFEVEIALQLHRI